MSGIALKLATLFARQISRPIANMLKQEAKNHASFKQLCIGVAQKMHFFDNTIKVKLNPPRPGSAQSLRHVRPLNEAKAIQSGADFLSEAFIFSVAAGGILFETSRQRKKEKNKRDAMADDIETLQDEIEFLKRQLQKYDLQLDDYKVPTVYKPIILKVDEDGKLLETSKSAAVKQGGVLGDDQCETEECNRVRDAIMKELKKLNEKNKEVAAKATGK